MEMVDHREEILREGEKQKKHLQWLKGLGIARWRLHQGIDIGLRLKNIVRSHGMLP